MSKVPLYYLVISIVISSQIYVQLGLSLVFVFGRKKVTFFVFVSVENDIVFSAIFIFGRKQIIIFGRPLYVYFEIQQCKG